MDIEGNEKADMAAKEAANPSNANTELLPIMKSARGNMINQATKKEWEGVWEKDITIARHLHRIIKRKHINKGMDVYNSIYERRNIAIIARLRTGHCSLNQHLHLIGKLDSPLCECSDTPESVDHYLLYCIKYDQQRAKLQRNVGVGGIWTEKLLGIPEIITYTLEYMKATDIFYF